MLDVITNLIPAMFSMERLLKNPTRPAKNPTRKQRVHFMEMYWHIWIHPRLRQSCFKSSMSGILQDCQILCDFDKKKKYNLITS